MKKIIFLFLPLLLVLTGCSPENENNIITQPFIEEEKEEIYVKSVWITYYELSNMIEDKSEGEFKKEVKKVYKELKEMGFNTVTVQVRAFADAFYKSDYFPVSKYCFGKQGSELKFDILEIMCALAEEYNLRIEAWVNPYRVSFDNDVEKLSEDNIAKKWLNNKKTKSNVFVYDKGIYFNPASKDVTDLIINGAVEIAQNYNV